MFWIVPDDDPSFNEVFFEFLREILAQAFIKISPLFLEGARLGCVEISESGFDGGTGAFSDEAFEF